MSQPSWQLVVACTTGGGEYVPTPYGPVDDVNWPIGSIFLSVVPENPASLIGVGTWEAFGQGKVLVGLDPEDPDFDTVEETGGSKAVESQGSNSTPSVSGATASEASHTHSVTSNVSVDAHASHTHTYSEIVQHTHAVNITDNGHTHTQNAHTHTQDAHTHTQNAHGHNVAPTSATTGSVTVTQAVFAADTSGTVGTGVASANIVAATAVNQNATATNQSTTAVNQSATTGITATTSNPAGSGASGTTNGPSASLTHAVNNTAVTSGAGSSHSHGAGTLAVSAPTFTGQATSVVQPYIVVYMFKRVA